MSSFKDKKFNIHCGPNGVWTGKVDFEHFENAGISCKAYNNDPENLFEIGRLDIFEGVVTFTPIAQAIVFFNTNRGFPLMIKFKQIFIAPLVKGGKETPIYLPYFPQLT